MIGRSPDDKLEEFARWARENLERLHDQPAPQAAEELGRALLRVDKQLGIEIADEVSPQREAIITAFSDPARFDLVRRVAALLHGIPGWRFVALKPPRGFNFELVLQDHEIRASDLRFETIPETVGGIRLVVDSGVPLPHGTDLEELAWLVVETGIGEELAGRLRHIEIGRPIGDCSRSIESLEAYCRALAARGGAQRR